MRPGRPTTTCGAGFTVGASAPIFGLLGALLVVARKARLDSRALLQNLGLGVAIPVYGFVSGGVSWQGHLGGAVGVLVQERRLVDEHVGTVRGDDDRVLVARAREVDAREVIVLTRPHVVAELFHVDWNSRARRKLGVPVLHLLEHENFDEQAGDGEGISGF